MVTDKEIISIMRQNAEKGFRLLMASYKEAASMKVSYNIAKEKIIAYMNNND